MLAAPSTVAQALPAGRVPVSAEVDARIRDESVVWLTTVSTHGQPCVVPTWFSWDGCSFVVFTKPDARKVRNLVANPSVMLALGDPAADFDVLLIEARAELMSGRTADLVPDAHFRKYAGRMAAIGLDRAEYCSTYSAVLRITPTRYLGWAGRTHLTSRRSPG